MLLGIKGRVDKFALHAGDFRKVTEMVHRLLGLSVPIEIRCEKGCGRNHGGYHFGRQQKPVHVVTLYYYRGTRRQGSTIRTIAHELLRAWFHEKGVANIVGEKRVEMDCRQFAKDFYQLYRQREDSRKNMVSRDDVGEGALVVLPEVKKGGCWNEALLRVVSISHNEYTRITFFYGHVWGEGFAEIPAAFETFELVMEGF